MCAMSARGLRLLYSSNHARPKQTLLLSQRFSVARPSSMPACRSSETHALTCTKINWQVGIAIEHEERAHRGEATRASAPPRPQQRGPSNAYWTLKSQTLAVSDDRLDLLAEITHAKHDAGDILGRANISSCRMTNGSPADLDQRLRDTFQ